ncbi:MAG: flagellar filament capping protein FliD [Candidatus Sericytochromatia bacterium]|nr:flagellar filament capping protein FliD [Candidatus Sericytochromatia bacterium]
MSDIRFSGLASGIDTQALIDKLIQLERRPITKLQGEISQNNTKLERLRALNTKLKALDAAAAKVMGSNGLASSPLAGRSATLSNTTVGAMTAAGSAPKGTYSFTVNAVAADAKMLGSLTGRAADDSLALGYTATNTYRISLDADPTGKFVDINLTDTTSLADVAAAINAEANSPVTATVTNATASQSRLVLVSKTSGEPGTFTVGVVGSEQATGPKLSDYGLAAGTASGTNASISIDGDAAITSSTNTFVDALPGTTFTAFTTGTTSVTIDNDVATARGAVKDLVARYNEVISQLREDTRYDPGSQRGGPLRSESGVRGLSQALSRMVTETFDGTGTNGTFSNYKAAGLTVNRDGTLSLDEKTLDDAIKSNPTELHRLFANEDGETSGSVRLNLGGSDTTMGDGLANRLRALVSSATDLSSPYNAVGATGGRSPGLVLGAINAVTRANTRLNDRIDGEERRVERRERLLRLQFQNMERAISGLRAQGSYLSNQLASLQGQQG